MTGFEQTELIAKMWQLAKVNSIDIWFWNRRMVRKNIFVSFLLKYLRRYLFSVEAFPKNVHGDVEEVERTPGEEEHHTHLKGWQCSVGC